MGESSGNRGVTCEQRRRRIGGRASDLPWRYRLEMQRPASRTHRSGSSGEPRRLTTLRTERKIVMNHSTSIIEVERVGQVIVLTPQRDLRELEFRAIREELCALAEDPTVIQVVMDFQRTDYMGSTALGMLVHLGKKVRQRGGGLAF